LALFVLVFGAWYCFEYTTARARWLSVAREAPHRIVGRIDGQPIVIGGVEMRDGREYVILPGYERVAYYLFRPIVFVDEALTGRRFRMAPPLDDASR